MTFQRRPLGFETLEARRVLSGVATPVLANTVFVNIPDNLTGRPGQQVVAPVNIDNATGLRGVEIRISYDTQILDVDASGLVVGSVWQGTDADVLANVDDATGSIVAWVFASEGISSGTGSLVTIQFAVRNDAPIGTSTRIDLERVRLNEGDIVADPEPIPGPDSTDGRITVVSAEQTARVSGTVYADTNENNQPDSFEGVPRVRILLTSLNGGQQRETFTDDLGQYEFRDLDAGAYRIEQQQPAAFLDGGPNQLAVQVTAGQELSGQNFRELGLRPEYVYNRLFSTPVMPVGSTDWIGSIRRIVADADEAANETSSLAVQTTTQTAAPVSPVTSSPPTDSVPAAGPAADAQPVSAATPQQLAAPPQSAALSAASVAEPAPAVLSDFPETPVLPAFAATPAATAAVNIPADLTAGPGQQITVPVNIDNPAGLRGVEIRINYDTQLLDTDSAQVLLGPLWAGSDAQVVANVNDTAGTILAWVYASEALGAGGGSLLQIRFTASNDAPVGTTTRIDFAGVGMNEGEIVADPEPEPGPDSTDGLITFVAIETTARVSGTVFADTNENNQPDPLEGVPRVRITLKSTDGAQELSTFTDDSGVYEFRDLSAGSYVIEQQQPAAFLDGGPNELSVQITEGQQLADQDFRERGLRPEFVYNRLYSTAALPVGSAAWINTLRNIIDDAETAPEEAEELNLLAANLVHASQHTGMQPVDLVFDNSGNWLE